MRNEVPGMRAVATRAARTTATTIGLAVLAMALLFVATAQARVVRPFTGQSFGPSGSGPGILGSVRSVAVDQTTGDVFALNSDAGGQLFKFNGAGEPVDFSSSGTNAISAESRGNYSEEEIAVDSSSGPDSGDIYVANNHVVLIYNSSGNLIGRLTGGEMCGVAVDPSGAVYVGIYPETVRKYVPSANPVTGADETTSMAGLNNVCNVAVDGEGNLYAATYYGGVRKYEAIEFGSLSATGTLIDDSGRTLAVDPATNDVYVNDQTHIAAYSPAGEPVSVAGEGEVNLEGDLGDRYGGSFGVAVDGGGDLYAPRGEYIEGRIDTFGAAVLEPDAATEAATAVAETGATLNGTVNPDGVAATYQFQYGPTTAYGSVAPATPAAVGSDSTAHQLSATLSGLSPSSTYHYRLIASNANGTTAGADQTFQTSGPPTISEVGAGEVTRSTAQVSTYVNPHGIPAEAWVEYGTTTSYGNSTTHTEEGAGYESRYFAAELTSLQQGSEYHFRVAARNENGTVVYGPDGVLFTYGAASISGQEATEVGSSAVALSVVINDLNTESTYHYEYGTTTAYGSSTAATTVGPNNTGATSLSGLQPDTQYHFRVVVSNSFGTAYGSDATFTTLPLAATPIVLPDGRGYEKVSPNANADGDVYQDIETLGSLVSEGGFTELPFVVSADGNAVAYPADPSARGGIGHEGADAGNEYLAKRAPAGGWSAENIDPSSSGFFNTPVYQGFAPDLSVGFLASNRATPLAPGAPAGGYGLLYERSFASAAYQSLITTAPPNRSAAEFTAFNVPHHGPLAAPAPIYAGSSAGQTHVLFMANDALTPDALDGGPEANNLYDSHDGTTTLVNVLPDGSTEADATFGGPVLPGGRPTEDVPALGHDISEDGSRIYWTDLHTHDLYLRENDTAPRSPVSEGRCTVAGDACTVLIAQDALFYDATPDGSKVLYSKGGDLYELDVAGGQSVDVAPGAEIQGVVGASEDLSYVYFVGEGALAPGATVQRCTQESAQEEKGEVLRTSGCNLYAAHIGDGSVRLVGVLSRSDVNGTAAYAERGDWVDGVGDKEAEATPDGSHLLFISRHALTRYPNNKTEQVYLYDFDSGQLSCVSCARSGEGSALHNIGGASAFLPISNMYTYLPHWISDDGDRVFFDTLDPLVTQDTNRITDVYEWERESSGSCTESPGCIYLISDGTSAEGSYLIGTTATGDDVFFTTRGQLVREDDNENIDVYDARVGAVQPPAASQCTGTGCQGVPSAPPIFATPASSTYNGVGNLELPGTTGKSRPTSKRLTRAQKLASALKACRKKHQAKRRATCERRARKAYGSHTSVKRGVKRASRKGNAR